MLVMKFGGASVKSAEAIRNVGNILSSFQTESVLVVVSAMGKTTNHLEELAFLARDGKAKEAKDQFEKIKAFHYDHIDALFEGAHKDSILAQVAPHVERIERIVDGILLLEAFPKSIYDRIVSHGEILSTLLVAAHLKAEGYDALWLDARQVVKTDASFKSAEVIWSLTEQHINAQVKPKMEPGRFIVTQGFIGSTRDGKTTTLGREGSDYTGSIFAYCLGAESLTVWKDVKGILNADPRIREVTIKHEQLSYEEAVEMTFYGASVIHPKTIKPIFTKQIPLKVKCFQDISEEGTIIGENSTSQSITSYIIKKNQAFIHIKPKDFSFMEEQLMNQIFDHVYKSGLRVNLVQHSAISLMLSADNKGPEPVNLASRLLDKFDVEVKHGLQMYTVINFKPKDLRQAAEAEMIQVHSGNLYYVK